MVMKLPDFREASGYKRLFLCEKKFPSFFFFLYKKKKKSPSLPQQGCYTAVLALFFFLLLLSLQITGLCLEFGCPNGRLLL